MQVKLLKWFLIKQLLGKFIQNVEIYIKLEKKFINCYVNTSNLLRNGYIYAKNYI